MTPTEIEDAARQMYNSVGSAFFSQEEILNYIYFAEMDLARKANAIQNVYSTPTIASTRDYTVPSNILSIKKITWDGVTLKKVDFQEDDLLTGWDEDTTIEGDPRYYVLWENTISLRPIPSSVKTLKIWTYNYPQKAAATSTLSVPAQYHPDIVLYCLAHMVAKDEKYDLSDRYLIQWNTAVENAKREIVRNKRVDQFAHVKDEELLLNFNQVTGL